MVVGGEAGVRRFQVERGSILGCPRGRPWFPGAGSSFLVSEELGFNQGLRDGANHNSHNHKGAEAITSTLHCKIALAIGSFPVPALPVIRTDAFMFATRPTRS